MLLAAGSATRLGSLAQAVPKPMLEVGGRPLIEHTVRQLARYGVEDIVINLHQLGGVVTRHFGDGSRFGVRIHYSEEETLLGTAGGVKKAAPLLDETFLLVYGDNLTTCRFDALVDFHRAHRGLATIALFWRDDVSAHSAVERREDGRIVRFVEKPRPEEAPSHWISAGVMFVSASWLLAIMSCTSGSRTFVLRAAANKPIACRGWRRSWLAAARKRVLSRLDDSAAVRAPRAAIV